jgi:hypothetical protein
MKSSHAITHAQIGLVALVLALGGCTANASFRAGSTTNARPARSEPAVASSQASAVTESTGGARADALSSKPEKADRPEKADKPGKADKPAGQIALAPPPADRDRGHGNDADGVDEDNPGKSKKPGKVKKPEKAKKGDKGDKAAEQALAASDTDKDRGHGNDADGVDEDNPGKSRDK